MYPELAGKTVVVTGGSHGVGAEIAWAFAAEGARVNCISPAAIRTERTAAHMSPEMQARVAAAHPVPRLGEPADIAATALSLSSAGASWLTGLIIDVT